MKYTAIAPSNIAFIKYWGNRNESLRLPYHNSISMNLSHLFTKTTIEFSGLHIQDEVIVDGKKDTAESQRVINHLDKIRHLAQTTIKAKVVSQNNFPKATGIASSASGFASLTLASTQALGLQLLEKELSKLSRIGSGSACRSVPDGFAEWRRGTGGDDSFAHQLYPPDWWEICDVVVIVSTKIKKVGSTEGHRFASTSPFYTERLKGIDGKIKKIKEAMQKRNFSEFGRIIEAEALNMHAICITCTPALLYWEPTTIAVMKKVVEWRENGDIESYFTIDAGPSVHIICEKKEAENVSQRLQSISGVERVVINQPAVGARVIKEYLF